MVKYNLNKDLLKYQNQKTDLSPAILPIVNRILALAFRMKKMTSFPSGVYSISKVPV